MHEKNTPNCLIPRICSFCLSKQSISNNNKGPSIQRIIEVEDFLCTQTTMYGNNTDAWIQPVHRWAAQVSLEIRMGPPPKCNMYYLETKRSCEVLTPGEKHLCPKHSNPFLEHRCCSLGVKISHGPNAFQRRITYRLIWRTIVGIIDVCLYHDDRVLPF